MTSKGWAELSVYKQWRSPTSDNPRRAWYDRQAEWQIGDRLRVYDEHWEQPVDLGCNDFTVRNHATGKDATGGHNWYCTTRFDVWFTHPLDGWVWHGWLISGGINGTFRVRRTKQSDLFTLPNQRQPFLDVWQHRFKQRAVRRLPYLPVLAVCDGDEPKWYAKKFADGWHFGLTPGDVFASRMLRAA